MPNPITQLLKADDHRLNLPLSEVIAAENIGAHQACNKLAEKKAIPVTSLYVGHLVTTKDHELQNLLTAEEFKAIVDIQEQLLNIPRTARAPSWKAPAQAFRLP